MLSEKEFVYKLAARKVVDDDPESGILGPFASGVLSLRGKIVSPQRSRSNIEAIEEGYILEIITDRPAALHFHSLTHYSWQYRGMWTDL